MVPRSSFEAEFLKATSPSIPSSLLDELLLFVTGRGGQPAVVPVTVRSPQIVDR